MDRLGFVLMIVVIAAVPGHWLEARACASSYTHIRTTNRMLLDALAEGTSISPTFQQLVDRLNASDVVAYLEARALRTAGVGAQTSFLTVAGGRRYLRISIDRHCSGAPLIALLGHELQHAVEIANAPSVVDARSLAECYRRIGFRKSADGDERFESAAAIDVGHRVLKELIARAHTSSH